MFIIMEKFRLTGGIVLLQLISRSQGLKLMS